MAIRCPCKRLRWCSVESGARPSTRNATHGARSLPAHLLAAAAVHAVERLRRLTTTASLRNGTTAMFITANLLELLGAVLRFDVLVDLFKTHCQTPISNCRRLRRAGWRGNSRKRHTSRSPDSGKTIRSTPGPRCSYIETHLAPSEPSSGACAVPPKARGMPVVRRQEKSRRK